MSIFDTYLPLSQACTGERHGFVRVFSRAFPLISDKAPLTLHPQRCRCLPRFSGFSGIIRPINVAHGRSFATSFSLGFHPCLSCFPLPLREINEEYNGNSICRIEGDQLAPFSHSRRLCTRTCTSQPGNRAKLLSETIALWSSKFVIIRDRLIEHKSDYVFNDIMIFDINDTY